MGSNGAAIAGGAGTLMGSMIPQSGTVQQQYGYNQSPEAKQALLNYQSQLANISGKTSPYVDQQLQSLPGAYSGVSNYLGNILSGQYTSPQAMQQIYQPYIDAANLQTKQGDANIQSSMNKYGVAGSTMSAGALGNYNAQQNANLNQTLAGLSAQERARQMQAAGLQSQLPGMQASALSSILQGEYAPLQGALGERAFMPQLEKTGATQISGPADKATQMFFDPGMYMGKWLGIS